MRVLCIILGLVIILGTAGGFIFERGVMNKKSNNEQYNNRDDTKDRRDKK